MKRALIVGSDDFVITAMRNALCHAPDVQALGVLERDGRVVEAIGQARPELVLVEASPDAERALSRLRELREGCPGATVLLMSADFDEALLEALLTGGSERRAPLALVPAPSETQEPECPLTPRELEVLRSVAEGHTNAEIGRELWLTEQTVKFHLSKIYRKLGVSNRTEASRYALLGALG
jgi:DNA-binding NarL/FixJ family response regulator